MIIHQYGSKAVQDDGQLAGERNRLLLEARRVRVARRERVVPAAAPGRPPSTPRHVVILRCGRSYPAFGVPTVGSTEVSSRGIRCRSRH